MKASILAASIALAILFGGEASAEIYKCVQDGKTSFQERPCGAMGGAETKVPTVKADSWAGCYHHEGSTFDGGGRRQETLEVRQDGSTLYTTDGTRDGPYETRLIWTTASARQLQLMREVVGREQKEAIEVTRGLVVTAAAKGPEVKRLPEEQMIMGLWWIRGLDIEGDPMFHLTRTKETLRGSKETLYVFGPYTFEKATKVPCAANK